MSKCSARQVVHYFKLRMQVEEGFRDTKSVPYGAGLEISRSRKPERMANLLLVAHMVNLVLWMIGVAVERSGKVRQLLVNTKADRSVQSSVFI